MLSAWPSILCLRGLPGSDIASLSSARLGLRPFWSLLALCGNFTPRLLVAIVDRLTGFQQGWVQSDGFSPDRPDYMDSEDNEVPTEFADVDGLRHKTVSFELAPADYKHHGR